MKKINKGGGAMKGMILGLCSLFVCGQLCAMQPDQGASGGSEVVIPQPARARAERFTAPPGAEASMTAFRAVESWVRAWHVPAVMDMPELAPTAAVCITLRLNGEVIARAEAVSSARAERAADQTDLVRQAAAEALEKAAPRLNVPNDAMREQAIREVAKNITISLELAGPFTLTEPDTWGDVDGTWKPGLDGVAVQAPGAADVSQAASQPVVAFPSTMLVANMIPSRAMSSVVARVIGEGGAAAALEEPKKLRAERGLRMYRFRVTHLAQSRADLPPEFLHRGGRLIPTGAAMTVGEMRQFASSLAAYLLSRLDQIPQTGVEGSAGGAVPPLSESASLLAAYALGWYHEACPMQPQPDAAVISKAIGRTWKHSLNSDDTEVTSFAVLVLPFVSPEFYPHQNSLFLGRYKAQVHEMFGTSSGMKAEVREDGVNRKTLTQIPVEWRARVLLAAMKAVDDREVLEGTSKALRQLFADTGEGKLVALLPWLGWAEIAQEAATREKTNTATDLPGALALRQLRSQCWQHQFSLTDAGGSAGDDADMIGGIVFTTVIADGKSSPYPTSQSVRPLAFIATMLGDARLTEPQERPGEIVRLLASMRFLRQLQVDESSAWMYPNPSAAIGGIRASVWDSSQPIEASALTLLCIVETLKSLEALAAPAPPVAPEANAPPAK